MQGLYLVTPDWDDSDRLLAVSAAALAAGGRAIAALQYRHKTAPPAQQLAQAHALQQLCRQHRVPFLINDHVDLCRQLGADGVHLGGTDAAVASARAALGPHAIIGASCYGALALAQAAATAGASYVAFGGFYPSRVKRYPVSTAPALLAQARATLDLPCVVIGGMTADNVAPLLAQGAQMVAVISSVYQAADPGAAVRALLAAMPGLRGGADSAL
ncbi:MAG: thiamine phosphate synthase [Sphingomonadaceae bacterium]